MSPERERYHAQLAAMVDRIPAGSTVYDIGVCSGRVYRDWFAQHRYVTVDREERKKPDVLLDLEGPIPEAMQGVARAALCNGVTETCGNPFAIVRGVRSLISAKGIALFGIMLAGYPIGEKADLTRFTPKGAVHLVQTAGFTVLESEICERNGVPSYAYLVCRG